MRQIGLLVLAVATLAAVPGSASAYKAQVSERIGNVKVYHIWTDGEDVEIPFTIEDDYVQVNIWGNDNYVRGYAAGGDDRIEVNHFGDFNTTEFLMGNGNDYQEVNFIRCVGGYAILDGDANADAYKLGFRKSVCFATVYVGEGDAYPVASYDAYSSLYSDFEVENTND